MSLRFILKRITNIKDVKRKRRERKEREDNTQFTSVFWTVARLLHGSAACDGAISWSRKWAADFRRLGRPVGAAGVAVGSRRTWRRVCNATGPLLGPNPLHTHRYPCHPRTYRYHPDTLFCRLFCHFDQGVKIIYNYINGRVSVHVTRGGVQAFILEMKSENDEIFIIVLTLLFLQCRVFLENFNIHEKQVSWSVVLLLLWDFVQSITHSFLFSLFNCWYWNSEIIL